jgi:hypothetical protein
MKTRLIFVAAMTAAALSSMAIATQDMVNMPGMAHTTSPNRCNNRLNPQSKADIGATWTTYRRSS